MLPTPVAPNMNIMVVFAIARSAKTVNIPIQHYPVNIVAKFHTQEIHATTAIHRTSTVRLDIPMVMIVAGKTKVQPNKYVIAAERIQQPATLAVQPRPRQMKAYLQAYRPAGRIVRSRPQLVATSTIRQTAVRLRPRQTKACPRAYRPAGRIVHSRPQLAATSTTLQTAARPRPRQTKACPRAYQPAGRIVRNRPQLAVTSTMLQTAARPRLRQTKACPRAYRPAGRIARNRPQLAAISTTLQTAARLRPVPTRAMSPLARPAKQVPKLPHLAATPATLTARAIVRMDTMPTHQNRH